MGKNNSIRELDFTNSPYPPNYRNLANGLDLLASLPENSIKASFFDPQYRGVLDHLNYGNEGKGRQLKRLELPQMSTETICTFITEIGRVLHPSGHLFLWLDKYSLATSNMNLWLKDAGLDVVDLITWDSGRFGMGSRSRCRAGYLLVLQKPPRRCKGCWTNHSIPDVWSEKVKKNHPHSKPLALQKALIEATTSEGDWVLDPASGGYSVLQCCQQTGRNFIGCDLKFGNQVHNDQFTANHNLEATGLKKLKEY